MDRLQLTESQQAFANGWRTDHNVNVGDEVLAGTNVVADDHLRIDDSWFAVVLGASIDSPGCAECYVPDWGDFTLAIPADQIITYTTDRAGPNGEVMPIVDEMQMQAFAAKASGGNPNQAAKEQRELRRDRSAFYRDILASVSDEQTRKRLRQLFRDRGLLNAKDDRP